MSPTTGQVLSVGDLATLRETDPAAAADYSVTIDGPPEAIAMVSAAVREASRRRNKAARKARRANR